MTTIMGRVRKFGNNINTDDITPAASLNLPSAELSKYAFSTVVKDFYKTVREGDIILAGDNFGCGSSREQATEIVKVLGIKWIVCQSMARIYYRNCIAIGLRPILSDGVFAMFEEKDFIEIDTDSGLIRNPATGVVTSFRPLPDVLESIINAGGILQFLKKGKKVNPNRKP